MQVAGSGVESKMVNMTIVKTPEIDFGDVVRVKE